MDEILIGTFLLIYILIGTFLLIYIFTLGYGILKG
jgi:hypothetical protein